MFLIIHKKNYASIKVGGVTSNIKTFDGQILDSDQSQLTDGVWLRHGDIHIVKKWPLICLHLFGGGTFYGGRGTVPHCQSTRE